MPRTFCKASIQNQLNQKFHLVHEEDVEPYAFIFEDEPRDVPTVFQIWERRDDPRPSIAAPTTHPDFMFTTPNNADFAIRRIGGSAGALFDEPETVSENSHYFIKDVSLGRRVAAIMAGAAAALAEVSRDTAGCPSLSQSEIVAVYQSLLTALFAAPRTLVYRATQTAVPM